MRLEQQLRRRSLPQLQRFIALMDDSSICTEKEAAIAWLQGQLLDLDRLRVIWTKLEPLSQKAVAFAFNNAGEFVQQAFIAQYGELPGRPLPNFRRRHHEPIMFDLFCYQGRLATDMMPLLAELVPPPEKYRLAGLVEAPQRYQGERESVPLQRWDTAWSAGQDLLTYLRMIAQGDLRLSRSTGAPTPASAQKYARQLVAGDFFPHGPRASFQEMSRPFAMHMIATSGGLVTYQELSVAGKEYLLSQEPALLLTAFETWLYTGHFDELQRIPTLKGQRRRQTRLSPPALRRELLVEALSWCPVGEWIVIDDFFRALDIWRFEIPIEESETRHLTLNMDNYKWYGWGHSGDYREIVQGTYIKTVLWEFLGGIGALDLLVVPADELRMYLGGVPLAGPVSRYDGLIYFRINPLGAYLFGQAQQYQAPGMGEMVFKVGADGVVRLNEATDLPPHIRLQLQKVGELLADGSYLLSPKRLLTAVAEGWTWTDISTFLEAGHQGTLPKAVDDMLLRLAENDHQFHIAAPALLITVKDPALLQMALDDEVLARYCRQVDEITLVIPAAREKSVRERLKTLTYLLR